MTGNLESIQSEIIRKTVDDIKIFAYLHKPRVSNLLKSPKKTKQMHKRDGQQGNGGRQRRNMNHFY